MNKIDLVIEPIYPIRVIKASKDVKKAANLLEHKCLFNVIGASDNDTYIPPKGYIVLDFGKEYSGALRILTSNASSREGTDVRIRLGESLGEVNSELGEFNSTNDHSPRDSVVRLKFLSDTTFSHSGFRFARIDNLAEGRILIRAIVLNYEHIATPINSYLLSNDKLIDNIYETATRTAYMCIYANYLVDGIKRDSLVWAGDMYVQIKTLLYTVGAIPQIKDTLLDIMENYSKDEWVNYIPTYSLWWTLSTLAYYNYTNDVNFLKRVKPRIEIILHQLNIVVSKEGKINFNQKGLPKNVSLPYFIGWSDYHKPNEEEAWYSLMKYTLDQLSPLFSNNKVYKDLVKRIIKVNIKKSSSKTFHALNVLAYYKGDKEVFTSRIKKENSTFVSYLVYKAMAILNLNKEALDSMKYYYGSMLKLGATTFFEEYDPKWVGGCITTDKIKNKPYFHASYGKECYIGYRLSLCHAWSSGPVPYLIEEILGVNFIDYKTIRIKPKILNIKEAKFMTSLGPVIVKVSNNKVRVICKPKDVKIIN